MIGRAQPFSGGELEMAARFWLIPPGICWTKGSWLDAVDRYLGLSFQVKGRTRYAWARLSVQGKGPFVVTLTGYAYETIPNKAIIAGRKKGTDDTNVEEPTSSLTAPSHIPATLGMLAIGAPGLAIWRREDLLSPWSQRE